PRKLPAKPNHLGTGAGGPPTGADAITADALASRLEGDIAAIDADLEAWSVDALEGPQVMMFNVESFQPVVTVADGRAMVDRWRAMGPWLDQHASNLRA